MVHEVKMSWILLWMGLAFAGPEMIPEEVWAAANTSAPSTSGLVLPLRGGGTFDLAAHRGRPVVVSYWASWCAPCRRELPALAQYAKAHPELTFLTVNIDRQAALADRFLQGISMDLPIALDPDARTVGGMAVLSMPTLLLFDRQGNLHWRKSGYSEENGFTELDQAIGALR